MVFHDDDFDRVLAVDGKRPRSRDGASERLPLSFVVMQGLRKRGYDGETLAWIVNRNEIIETVEGAGLKLERTFRLGSGWWLRDTPENPIREEGLLFSVPDSS